MPETRHEREIISYLSGSFSNWRAQRLFNIENDIAPWMRISCQEDGGIGLENVKKRLMLRTQNHHELIINEDGKVFSVTLRINNV